MKIFSVQKFIQFNLRNREIFTKYYIKVNEKLRNNNGKKWILKIESFSLKNHIVPAQPKSFLP